MRYVLLCILERLIPIQLESIDLPGELACSFPDAAGAMLLIARTLGVQRADGAERTWAGTLTCGC